MKRFEKKVVLLTGGGSGLGQAAALQLAAEGAKLVLVDLNKDGLEETKAKIEAATPGAETVLITANVVDEKAVENFVMQTVATFGKIDAFFNNAGVEGKQNLTETTGWMNSKKLCRSI